MKNAIALLAAIGFAACIEDSGAESTTAEALVSNPGWNPGITVGGSSVQLDATRDVELSINVIITGTINDNFGFDTVVNLLCDANVMPFTFADAARWAAHGPIGFNGTTYSTLRATVPAGHRCRLVAQLVSGSPTVTVLNENARARN